MLAREVGAPNNTTRRFSMHLLVAAKAHHRSGAFHSRHIFNGITGNMGLGGMRVAAFDGTRDLEGGHIF
jgi:hypothetical protein